MTSAVINSAGSFVTATIQGEDPTWKVVGAAAGSYLGGKFGDYFGKSVGNAAIASAIHQYPALSRSLGVSISPVNAVSSSFISELTGSGFDYATPSGSKK